MRDLTIGELDQVYGAGHKCGSGSHKSRSHKSKSHKSKSHKSKSHRSRSHRRSGSHCR